MSTIKNNFQRNFQRNLHSNSQKGAGLIEVLVALFILAVGLFGVLAVQSTGQQNSRRSENLSAASFIATQMVQMIAAYDAFDDPASDVFNALESSRSPTAVDCSSGCARDTQVNHDLADWSDQIINLLPSGVGTVAYDAGTEMYSITVMWDEQGTGATGRNCSGDPEVDLECFNLEVQI